MLERKPNIQSPGAVQRAVLNEYSPFFMVVSGLSLQNVHGWQKEEQNAEQCGP